MMLGEDKRRCDTGRKSESINEMRGKEMRDAGGDEIK